MSHETDKTPKIIGSGGKSGGSAPAETPDSLRSKQRARVIELISEGEIVGLLNGLKSVYLDDVPIQNADDSYNFTGVTLTSVNGTPHQDYIPGFTEQESEHTLGVEVKFNTPYTFQIPERNSSSADAVRVTIGVPGLTFIAEDGSIEGTSVDLVVMVQNNGGGYVVKLLDKISGKTGSRYQRSYRIALPANESGPWDVRISRTTPDSDSVKLTNATYVDSYTIISETKMRYSNSAAIAIEIDSEKFPSIPVRAYHSRGIKILVPNNYDPITRTYTGDWNGALVSKYSNNPAWVLYDLLTNNRYGLGKYIDPTLIDKWYLYSMAIYCDQLVPNGYGGMEPRYTCNLFIQTREEAFTLISNIASIAHAAAYGTGGGIGFVQDAPRDPIALYSAANVVDAKFEYSGASVKAQHNVVLVAWNDPQDKYRQKIEYVEDAESIEKYGIVQTEVVAMGCTSRGQARRFGRAIIFAEKFEGSSISFAAGLDSYRIYPGAVFETADANRNNLRNAGRVISATDTTIEIDAPISLTQGYTHTLKVITPAGNVEERTIGVTGNNLTVLTVTQPFSQPPVAMAIWMIKATDKPTESWVCISAEEDHDTGHINIIGMSYRPEKYALIESNEPLPPAPVYNPYNISPPPTNITARASINSNRGIDILLSWEVASGTRATKILWKREDENYEEVTSYNNSYIFRNVSIGVYSFILSTVNAIGIPSVGVLFMYNMNTADILPDIGGLILKQPFVDKYASFEWVDLTTATGYKVQVVVNSLVVREVLVTNNWFTYDYADSVADGGPYRAFTLRVKATNGVAESGNWVSIDVENPAPPIPALDILEIPGGLQFYAPMPEGTDFAGMIVWGDVVSGFPTDELHVLADVPSNTANVLGLVPGVPYYVRAAFYDVFGKVGLNITSEYIKTPLSNMAEIPVVSEFPIEGLTQGMVVYKVQDDKLYRYDGQYWVTWVDGSDILQSSVTAGKIYVTSLHTLSAHMGMIESGNITLDVSSWIRGGQSAYRNGNGFWIGYHSLSNTYRLSIRGNSGAEFIFDGNDIALYDPMGNPIFTAAGISYDALSNAPLSLADINSLEAAKLLGIETGATRNAYLGEWDVDTTYQYGDVVTKDGSAWTYIYGLPTSGNAPPTLPTTSNLIWGLYASQGPQGDPGVNGTRTAILDMYIASATVPTTFPSGTSTYTWATGQFTAPGTPNGWTITPPTPDAGEVLYVIRQLYSDQLTTADSTVTWSATALREAGGANGADGEPGVNGTRTAFLELYRWSAAAPTTFPNGNSTYTWATGEFTAPTVSNGWSLTPGASVPGQTLWACSVRYADTDTTATTVVAWNTTLAYAVGAAGSNGATAMLAVLTATSQAFLVDKLGAVTPNTITLKAFGQNLTGNPVFTVDAGTATLIEVDAVTRTLSYVGLTTEFATIKITWDGQVDYITIVKVREGADGDMGPSGLPGDPGIDALTAILSNEAHTVPSTEAGNVLSYLNSGTTIRVYEGVAPLNAGNLGPGSFTVSSPVASPVGSISPGGISYLGQLATVGAHSGMLAAEDTVTLTYSINVTRLDNTQTSFNKVQTITKSKTGAKGSDGIDALTVILSNEMHTLPANYTGLVTSYLGSGTTIQVFEGANALLAGGTANGSFTVGTPTKNPVNSITAGGISYDGITATVADHSAMGLSYDSAVLSYPISIKRGDGTTTTVNKLQTLAKSKAGTDGSNGEQGPMGPSITLTANRSTAFTALNGNLEPTTAYVNQNITFTANVSGITSPVYTWTFEGFGSAPPNPGNVSTATVTASQFGNSKAATVKCTVNGTIVDIITIVRLEKNTAAGDADSTQGALTYGVTINSGGLTVGSGGAIKGGATSYSLGTGWWMGYEGGLYKFRIGNIATQNYMAWDGSSLTVMGTIQATTLKANTLMVTEGNIYGNAVTDSASNEATSLPGYGSLSCSIYVQSGQKALIFKNAKMERPGYDYLIVTETTIATGPTTAVATITNDLWIDAIGSASVVILVLKK